MIERKLNNLFMLSAINFKKDGLYSTKICNEIFFELFNLLHPSSKIKYNKSTLIRCNELWKNLELIIKYNQTLVCKVGQYILRSSSSLYYINSKLSADNLIFSNFNEYFKHHYNELKCSINK